MNMGDHIIQLQEEITNLKKKIPTDEENKELIHLLEMKQLCLTEGIKRNRAFPVMNVDLHNELKLNKHLITKLKEY